MLIIITIAITTFICMIAPLVKIFKPATVEHLRVMNSILLLVLVIVVGHNLCTSEHRMGEMLKERSDYIALCSDNIPDNDGQLFTSIMEYNERLEDMNKTYSNKIYGCLIEDSWVKMIDPIPYSMLGVYVEDTEMENTTTK